MLIAVLTLKETLKKISFVIQLTEIELVFCFIKIFSGCQNLHQNYLPPKFQCTSLESKYFAGLQFAVIIQSPLSEWWCPLVVLVGITKTCVLHKNNFISLSYMIQVSVYIVMSEDELKNI